MPSWDWLQRKAVVTSYTQNILQFGDLLLFKGQS